MSLILEALRKSEAERRRGRAPDLHAELPPALAPRRRVPSAWLATISVVVILLLVSAVFWPRGEDAFTASRDAARPDIAPIADDASPARANTSGRKAASGDAASPPAFPRIDRLSPPAAPVADAAPPERASPVEQTPPATAATRDTPDTARLPDATPLDPPSSVAPAPRTPAPTTPPRSTATADAPIRYAELPAPERQQLPPMKLTMHLWNDTAARRFVIIDDQRYVEGDRIGSGTIAAIDPDGVVIELNGRRVRVPLR